jgi:hypothetical protein
MSDLLIIRWKKRRGGVWYPEDRLRTAIRGALLLVPLTMIASGVLVELVSSRVGLMLNLICLFINGFSVCASVASSRSVVRS